MAIKHFTGDAEATFHALNATVGGTIEVGDEFNLTIAGEVINFTAATTTIADIVAGLVAAWNTSTVPEATEITATDNTTFVTLTCDNAGVEIAITAETTESGGGPADLQTFVMTVATALQGPNVYCADNFGGTLPAATDEIVFENSSVSLLYGIAPSTGGVDLVPMIAINMAKITVKQTYTGQIGLPRTNTTFGYSEYRSQFLKFGTSTTATEVNIGEGTGNGSGRIKIDVTGQLATINVYNSGANLEVGIPSLLINGSNVSNEIFVNRGTVGAGFFEGDAFDYLTARVGFITSQSSDASLVIGTDSDQSGVGEIVQTGGFLSTMSNVITVTMSSGTFVIGDAATSTAINIDGGSCVYASEGIGTLINVGNGASLDFRQDTRDRTITQCNVHSGGTVLDPAQSVTWSNGIDLVRCAMPSVNIDVGPNLTYTVAPIP